jgi:hypothetical protein
MFPRRQVNSGEVEEISVGIVTVDLEYFRDESSSRAAFDLHDHVQRIPDIRLDGTNAKVSPATTMATRERPRAMVLVKAVSRTLTAFSQGELPVPCPNVGAARRSVNARVARADCSERLCTSLQNHFLIRRVLPVLCNSWNR